MHSGILLTPMLLGLTLAEIACAERVRRKRMAGTLAAHRLEADSQPLFVPDLEQKLHP